MCKYRVTVCSLFDNMAVLRDLVERNHIAYCDKHGYTYYGASQRLDPLRHPSWSKILVILKCMRHAEWVLWIDADAVFVNMDVEIPYGVIGGSDPSKLPFYHGIRDENIDLAIRKDVNGVNNGVMLFYNTDASYQFLFDVYATYIDHPPFHEQAATNKLLNDDPSRLNVQVVDKFKLNCYPDELVGTTPFILHALDRTLEQRVEILTPYSRPKVLTDNDTDTVLDNLPLGGVPVYPDFDGNPNDTDLHDWL